MAERLGNPIWVEDGEGVTHRRYLSTPVPADASDRVVQLHDGEVWRAMLGWLREWAQESLPTAQEEPQLRAHIDRGWFAIEIIRQWEALEQAEAAASPDMMIMGGFALAATARDLQLKLAVEPDWERGLRNREATSRGGTESRRAPHVSRIAAMNAKLAERPDLSDKARAKAVSHEALGQLGTWRSILESWKRRNRAQH